MTEKPLTATAKMSASSSSRFSSHSLRLGSPSPNKNARRTQRVTQGYQRVSDTSTRLCSRRSPSSGSPWGPGSSVRHASRSVEVDFPARRQKSTSQSIEPPAIYGNALQFGSFFTLYSEESKAQCVSFQPRPAGLRLMSPRNGFDVGRNQ